MRAHVLAEPEFDVTDEFFKVTFNFDKGYGSLNVRQNEFLKFNHESEITIKAYMAMFNVVRNTATNDLNELVVKDMLKKLRMESRLFIVRLLED